MNKINKVSVLYVEDDENVHALLLRYLKRRFENVYSAFDGKKGLELFKEHKPDIVISDIKMPIMDGLEMSEKIRQIDKEVPIVIATAYSEIQFLYQAIEIGVDGYVNKPIKKEEINRILDKFVELRLAKKRIEERDSIIQAMLYLNPCFSFLIDGENIVQFDLKFLKCFRGGNIPEVKSGSFNLKEIFERFTKDLNSEKIENIVGLIKNRIQPKDKISLIDELGNDLGDFYIKLIHFKNSDLQLMALTKDKNQQNETIFSKDSLEKLIETKISC